MEKIKPKVDFRAKLRCVVRKNLFTEDICHMIKQNYVLAEIKLLPGQRFFFWDLQIRICRSKPKIHQA